MHLKSFSALTLFTILFSLSANAETRTRTKPKVGPLFETPLTFTVPAGKTTTVRLQDKLVEQGVPPYTWTVKNNLSWVSFNAAQGTLTFAPSQMGNFFIQEVLVKDSHVPEANQDFRTNVLVTVLPPPPEFISQDVDLGITPEGTELKRNVKEFLKDPSVANSFDARGLPEWLTINKTTGEIKGTPARKHEGNYRGITLVATGPSGTAETAAHGTVTPVLKLPKWTGNPLTLDDVKEDEDFVRETSGFTNYAVSGADPEASPLEYELVTQTPPPWLKLGKTTGTLFGKAPDATKVEVAVRLKTTIRGQNYTDTTIFKFEVLHVNHAPVWNSDPMNLPNAGTGVLYKQDLSKAFTDEDVGDTHTCSLSNQPSWLSIDPVTCILSGTPGKTHIGDNTAVVVVKDQGNLSDSALVKITVFKSNEPPTWNTHPVLLPDAKEDDKYELTLSDYAKDPDNDPMTFTVLSSTNADWLTVSPSGAVVGRPKKANVGITTLQVRVSDKISTPDDVTEVKIIVTPTNHAPYWVLNPIQLKTKEDAPMNVSIAAYAKDDDGDTLTFSAIAGDPWATLSPTGTFTGTPRAAQVGANEYTVRVSDGSLTADVKVIITVEHVNHAPYWTANPVVLPDATEDAQYTAALKPFAKDDDPGDDAQLRFVKISGAPTWLTVSSDGTVSGKPGKNEAGRVFTFEARVLDPSNADAVATVSVKVNKVNHPPRWRQDPVPLTDAFEDLTYKFNLATYAEDPDGDTLKFRKVSGPDWMFVGEAGDITGTPSKPDLGTHDVVFEVTDGEFPVKANAKITVIHLNHPPVIPVLAFEVKERETLQVDLKTLTNPVMDPDGDPLNCVLLNGQPWVTLTADCVLTAKPMHPQIGDHTFTLKVDDKQEFSTGDLKIKVLKNPRPPRWVVNPINMEAETNTPFNETLKGKAVDDDGLPLTFSKVAGTPTWLTVAPDGTLSGTPKDGDVGMNEFKVRVCNPDLCATPDADLKINVKISIKIITVNLETPVPGAKSEQLWVIDNSKWCTDSTIKALKKNINVFSGDLAAGQVEHQSVLISTDLEHDTFPDSEPVRDQGEKMLMSFNDIDWVGSFRRRVDLSYTNGICHNCNNSPIFAMYRLFERLPNMSEIYHNGYVMPRIPSDVLFVTHQRDYYKHYTKNIPALKNYTPSDFVRDFILFHRKEEKTLRINAMAPACAGTQGNPALHANGKPEEAAPENAYRTIVEKTRGKYFATGCQFDMVGALKEYAQMVKFTAYVHAKERIKLNPPPLSSQTIKVWVANVEIPASSGKWSFDASTNEVVIRWDLIDEGQLKPGDTLRIEYRVN